MVTSNDYYASPTESSPLGHSLWSCVPYSGRMT